MPTLANDLRAEEDALRRRFIHHTRPKGLMSLAEAIEFAEKIESVTAQATPRLQGELR
jgi:hypothetical protein